jgi:hypothetical protein
VLSREFIQRLQYPPIPVGELAKRVRKGQKRADRFWVARFRGVVFAIHRRDARVVRLGRALGLEVNEMFADPRANPQGSSEG